nr:MAG TPA: GIY-YIG nuclease superfamily protein [Caudoviricetes sp.]
MVIYEAINKINNKRYIGQTKDFPRRKKQHEKSNNGNI